MHEAADLTAALRLPGDPARPAAEASGALACAGDRLFAVAVDLGARVIDSHVDGCTFELSHAIFRLELLRGLAGEHVVGSTDLREISPPAHAKQVLLGLYLADRLSAETGFPAWCGLDHATQAYRLCFAVSADAIASGGLAEAIRQVHALRLDPGLVIDELA